MSIINGPFHVLPTRVSRFVPFLGHEVFFTPRAMMLEGHPSIRAINNWPPAPLPINWYDGIQFPMYGNAYYGCCFYSAGCHGDNTFTGNVGDQSQFSTVAVVKDYLRLSGGDYGLTEGQMIYEWTRHGLADIDDATIYDSLDIDPTNKEMMRGAIQNRGGVGFTFAVPDRFIDEFRTGCIWDAPCTPNPWYGHAVWFNGVDERGYYRCQTWGSWCWLTPDAVRQIWPQAFTVFSHRWYNPANSISPNNTTYDEDRNTWRDCGGGSLPDSPYPPPPVSPPLPPSPPTITDEPQVQVWFSGNNQGQYYKVAPGVAVEQVQQENGNTLVVWPNNNKISFTPGHWQPKPETASGLLIERS
jgi:hypothetical protein